MAKPSQGKVTPVFTHHSMQEFKELDKKMNFLLAQM